MRIFPYYFETLVLPLSSEKVVQVLLKNTSPPKVESESKSLFLGHVDSHTFRISEKINRPDNFVPLIKGTIENTSKGSIIFTSYNLMFSTALFVAFWSIVTLVLALILILKFNESLYSAISLGAFFLNYVITSINFHRRVKDARQTFYSLFTK